MSRQELLERVSAELGQPVPYYLLKYAIAVGRVPPPKQKVGSAYAYGEDTHLAFVEYMRQRLATKVA